MATPDNDALTEAKAAIQLELERLAERTDSAWRNRLSRLSQAARRLRTFDGETQWSRALVETTEGFCRRAALFNVNQQFLEFRAARNIVVDGSPRIRLASAGAFASAVESKDTVIALRTRGELSESIANLVGEAPGQRFHLFPLSTRDRVAAVLYADSDEPSVETSALELIASIGGAVLDGLRTDLSQISGPDQDLGVRAQRFARVQAAEMRLYKAEAVKEGRADRDLYGHLREEIDASREAYRREYLTGSMPDYLHLELVRTLANDDEEVLGPEYPGPLG